MAKKTKTHKIKKILIANRGEIACRVMKTARKMGIATVAVYSDADRKALHVRMADEAVHIGPSAAIESYLVIDKIIKAAKDTGAYAIHPGYGFLSENPDFVRACQKAKITFIGPAPESMEAMGLKDAAKKLMDEAGVPITPGYHGKDQSPKLLKAKAGMIGYPVLIKAVAGGGGKGMRKVEAEEDFDAMLTSCQREAKSSFNNDDVLIEKYIQSPRHIEVQVFGDTHGNVVHMFERDCSLQRRHQKVIEEAPAPGMTKAVRKAMTDAAIDAAKAVNYVGAGTVEFIVDGSGKLKTDGFWFMEMNTRLQVEHPVTEMITGLDLVELQIRVAQGEKLPKQKDIKMEGHAIEARLYAEDPANDFLPSVGSLKKVQMPLNAHYTWGLLPQDNQSTPRVDFIRFETSVYEGDAVSQFYDPMIGKLISHCDNRKEAIFSASTACAQFGCYPLKSNAFFLKYCLNHETFASGNIHTNLISEMFEEGINFPDFETDCMTLAAGLNPVNGLTPFENSAGWRLNQPSRDHQYVWIDNEPRKLPIGDRLGGWRYDSTDIVFAGNRAYKIGIPDDLLATAASSNALTAPMPGKIIAVNAKAGDSVKAGDPLIIMEAMKMEMTLEAPRDGVVAEVNATADALVTDGEMLLSLEEDKQK